MVSTAHSKKKPFNTNLPATTGRADMKRGREVADVEGRGAADVADAAERGRGHEDPSGCLRKTRDRAQQKVDSSVLAHVFNA